ncbi:hypothetical protein [Loktanella sp. Alg231-35]|uniref:hypothetical protein n=1 Tax=Loktanella sp. Alg231-35 TaxID=1922220 RepID=UPI000D550D0D|nr:hypothetical protein [Loktanella sp. Alg231-35]
MTKKTTNQRDDILVSVGLTEALPTQKGFDALQGIAAELDQRFRYWEIIVLADPKEHDALSALFGIVPNLRLLKVRTGTSHYRRRIVLAVQAIGDVLAITTSAEADHVDLITMIETSVDETGIVVSRREKGNLLDPVIGALGKASGFHVSSRDLQTVVYPRALLDTLASRPDKGLALRFAPRDAFVNVIESTVKTQTGLQKRSLHDTRRRLSIIQKLIVNLAPRVLSYLSVLSAIVAFVAILFVFYVFGVWMFMETIQPGWITTSLILSGTAAFLGMAVFCLSSGLQMIIELLLPDHGRDVIGESSSVDLFSDVMTELNVDLDMVEPEVAPPVADKVHEAK